MSFGLRRLVVILDTADLLTDLEPDLGSILKPVVVRGPLAELVLGGQLLAQMQLAEASPLRVLCGGCDVYRAALLGTAGGVLGRGAQV